MFSTLLLRGLLCPQRAPCLYDMVDFFLCIITVKVGSLENGTAMACVSYQMLFTLNISFLLAVKSSAVGIVI